MQELIERIGIPLFVQCVIEIWNSVFLLIMIFSLRTRTRFENTETSVHNDIPYSKEITIFYNTIFVYNLINVISILSIGSTTAVGCLIVRITGFLYYVTGAFQTLFFLQLIKKYVAQKNGLRRLEIALTIIQLMQIPALFLLAVTPFTGALYYFDENNMYHRGSLFMCWQWLTIISFLFIFIVYIFERKKTDSILRKIICTASVIPTLGFILNLTGVGISYNNITVSITALIIFIFFEKYRADFAIRKSHELDMLQTQLVEKKLALEQSKNAVLMAQIQPHFINNSLMALRSRCRDYPEIYRSLTQFSKYLRSHFEAIGDTKMISFEREMENVEAYLDLERENYGDRLRVEYNIECDDFLVPALSVQPLVENAVRHGVGTYENGGTLYIKTFRQNGTVCIEITDSSSGMSSMTEQQKSRKGIGIDNVRSRLQTLNIGDLEITRSKHGMTARLTIKEQGGTK